MAEPNRAQLAAQLQQTVGTGDFLADAPGGDIDLDQLFPNPENPAAQQQAQAPQQQAAQQPAAEPFLRAETGTVYATREDAVKGVTEKDRVIAELRQKIAERDGVDPLRKGTQTQAPQAATQPKGYLEEPEKFYDDLASAAASSDKRRYFQATDRLVEEKLSQLLGPLAPLMNEVAHEKALREADKRAQGSREYVGGEDYQALIEQFPILQDAIKLSESNPVLGAAQLDQLYALATLASQGRKASEIARQALQQVPQVPATTAQPQPRSTLQASSSTPGQPVPVVNMRNSDQLLRTHEGRQAIIDRFNQGGIDRTTLESVGL